MDVTVFQDSFTNGPRWGTLKIKWRFPMQDVLRYNLKTVRVYLFRRTFSSFGT
jgi:hypothetical protein